MSVWKCPDCGKLSSAPNPKYTHTCPDSPHIQLLVKRNGRKRKFSPKQLDKYLESYTGNNRRVI